jgi:hypothetical protein
MKLRLPLLLQVLLVFLIFNTASAFPVDPLPEDNLIDFDSAWMRNSEAVPPESPAGWGSWVDETGHMGLSQSPPTKKNPTPDDLWGTAAQWDKSVSQTANPLYPGEVAIAHLVVAIPDPHSELSYSRYHVGRGNASMAVELYGWDEAEWVYIGDFISDSEQIPRRFELSDLSTLELVTSYESYKLVQYCSYAWGNAGCKTTGHYLSAGE